METTKQLSSKILSFIARLHKVVYIVCDTYPKHSIKGREGKIRSEGERFLLVNLEMKIASGYGAFQRNDENKESLSNSSRYQEFKEKKIFKNE